MSRSAPFSAGDLEKFSYCPLSWWLGGTAPDSDSRAKTAEGTRKHESLSSDLTDLSASQRSVAVYSRMIMYYALISTLLAVVGISLLGFSGKVFISRLLVLLAVLWLMIAISLLYLARWQRLGASMGERWSVFTALGAVLFAVISITSLQVSVPLAQILVTGALIWLIGASLYLYFSLTAERSAAVIAGSRKVEGRVIYVGDDSHHVLYSQDGSFSGKPDFIVEENGAVVPGEFKSGRKPAGPLFSHIIQLSVYCKLVEDNYGMRPDFGYIYYGTRKHVIDFDDDMEKLLMQKAEEMRKCIASNEAHRTHRRPGKCQGCARRSVCPERLV